MNQSSVLKGLITQGSIWPARRQAGNTQANGRISSGLPAFDQLIGGGWPTHGLIELLMDGPGLGESRLLNLLWQARQRQAHWHACIAAPCVPYAPALQAGGMDPSRWLLIQARNEADVLWSAEQCLRSESCASVLAWPKQASLPSLRRLQLLAEEHSVPVVLFRPARQAEQGSPAVLRLRLSPKGQRTHIEVIKCRGGAPRGELQLDLFSRQRLPSLPATPLFKRSPGQLAWPNQANEPLSVPALRH
jgi:cell division inhibitor SulA/protein ImuA